jgi:hypothetical protein
MAAAENAAWLQAKPGRRLALGDPLRLMPALVALKDANFGTVLFDRIGRASSQMRIAAAFDAAKRPNKFQFLDDEGTLLHSPPPTPDGRTSCSPTKGAKFGPLRSSL